jgi:hypothetical protein
MINILFVMIAIRNEQDYALPNELKGEDPKIDFFYLANVFS